MELFRETLIILGIYLIGEFISSILNLPVPGNILGMLILLCRKILKIENIEIESECLLSHLLLFFIPVGVGLMPSMDIIKSTWIQIFIVYVITTMVIMGGIGTIIRFISSKKKIEMNEGEDIGSNTR